VTPTSPTPADRLATLIHPYICGKWPNLHARDESLPNRPPACESVAARLEPDLTAEARQQERDRIAEAVLAAKAANANVLRLLAYWRLEGGHPGIFAREVEAALDAALAGAEYQPKNESHGQQVRWTMERLRPSIAAIEGDSRE
jgi:hypothetical protein